MSNTTTVLTARTRWPLCTISRTTRVTIQQLLEVTWDGNTQGRERDKDGQSIWWQLAVRFGVSSNELNNSNRRDAGSKREQEWGRGNLGRGGERIGYPCESLQKLRPLRVQGQVQKWHWHGLHSLVCPPLIFSWMQPNWCFKQHASLYKALYRQPKHQKFAAH